MSTRIVETTMYASNEKCWAIGRIERGKFNIRRVVWGRLLAREERRDGEKTRRALVLVTGK